MTSQSCPLFLVLLPKHFIPHNQSTCHLVQKVTQIISILLRDTLVINPLTRWFNNKAKSCIFNKFFSLRNLLYIFRACQESISYFLRDTFYGGKKISFFERRLGAFLIKDFFQIGNLFFKEREFFDKWLESKGFEKVFELFP